MQAARDRQKSYADLKRKPMEFQVGDKVMLKVSPWKWVIRFGKRGKLNPRYVGPFKVLEKVGEDAYKLKLPEELSRVYNTFHVSNFKKCYADIPLAVPLDNVSNTPSHVDKNVERIIEDVSTDADVSDAMRSDCNNDGSSGEAANVDKNAASGNVNGISSFASLVRPNLANSKVNSVNGISQRKEGSFASLLRPKEVTNKLRFRTLVNKEKVECSDCVLPKAAANLVKSRYENSIVGFFVGKDPSFPVVQNYVSNTWSKFGFEKITRNDNGVYLFKFASKAGLEQVLERGPWMIRKSPIILNKWSSSVSLKKGEVTKVPVWVKLYNVPVLAYSEDGLSLIATQIGKPVMLDAFTSSMCVESWGRISFARALIEISSASTLKKEVIMAIPEEEGDGHIKEVIRVEYEWKPPHCVECKSFGHSHDLCPKRVRDEVPKAPSMVVKPSTHLRGLIPQHYGG
ncbi:reverse transcriptase domain-containing protein [Tanacetum coccineum]